MIFWWIKDTLWAPKGPKIRKEVRVAEKVENKPLLDMTWKKQKPLKKEGRK